MSTRSPSCSKSSAATRREKIPRRDGSNATSGSSCKIPDCSPACITELPAGRLTRRITWRSGVAQTTSTVMRSAIHLLRLAAKIVHHAAGQPLETQLQRRAAQASGIIEIQLQRDLAAVRAERDEIPETFQAAKGPVHQAHLQAMRMVDRVTGGEAVMEAGELEIQPCHQHVV